MSADNGIYILKCKDGWRVAHAQSIDNIYWWPDRKDGQYVQLDSINPVQLYRYFKGSKNYKTEGEATSQAYKMYRDIMNDDMCPIVEYGISYISGWERKLFPTKRRKK
jgi:hypothetical protein